MALSKFEGLANLLAIKDKIDIHQLAIRVLDTFQDFDSKLLGIQLTKMSKSSSVLGMIDPSLPPQYIDSFMCHEFELGYQSWESSNGVYNPSVDTFFAPHMLEALPTRKEQEDVYWQMRVAFSFGILPVIILELARNLAKKKYGHHSYFLGKHLNVKREVVEVRIPLKDVVIRLLHYTPTTVHIVYYTVDCIPAKKIETFMENNRAIHPVIVCNGQWVLDPTSMQFGMRGSRGEIIGRLEKIQHYVDRFPGYNKYLTDCSPEKERNNMVTLYKENSRMADAIVKKVLEDLGLGKQWCAYCGKMFDETHIQHWCAKCRKISYCGKNCQTGDWTGHKSFCRKEKKAEGVIAGADAQAEAKNDGKGNPIVEDEEIKVQGEFKDPPTEVGGAEESKKGIKQSRKRNSKNTKVEPEPTIKSDLELVIESVIEKLSSCHVTKVPEFVKNGGPSLGKFNGESSSTHRLERKRRLSKRDESNPTTSVGENILGEKSCLREEFNGNDKTGLHAGEAGNKSDLPLQRRKRKSKKKSKNKDAVGLLEGEEISAHSKPSGPSIINSLGKAKLD